MTGDGKILHEHFFNKLMFKLHRRAVILRNITGGRKGNKKAEE